MKRILLLALSFFMLTNSLNANPIEEFPGYKMQIAKHIIVASLETMGIATCTYFAGSQLKKIARHALSYEKLSFDELASCLALATISGATACAIGLLASYEIAGLLATYSIKNFQK